jgi:hypothetical protein
MKLVLRSYFRGFGALSAALLFAHQTRAAPAAYPTVTDQRLAQPDDGDWLMYRRTYDGSGFSPLKQITPSNVRQLTLAWSMSTDLLGAHETTSIVNQGGMFIQHIWVGPYRSWGFRSHWRTASMEPEHRQASLAAQFQDHALVTAVGHGRGHPLRRWDSGSLVQSI